MDVIINYSFGSDKPDFDRFNLSFELRCFLRYLKSEFLDCMSPKCLLDSPFIWGDADKCRFLTNVDYLLKRGDYSRKSYELLSAIAVVRFCSNVFRHHNEYADECGETKIGKIRIVRKLSEALPNLFVNLFNGCISHAYCLKELYVPDVHEAVY
ncbi:hypothetical protein Gotur_029320 [Gossypium turneri]